MKDPLPLLSALFDGTLTDKQAAELRAKVKSDPQFAEEVVLAAALHSNLRDLLSGQRELSGLSNELSHLDDAHILPALDEAEEAPVPQVTPGKLPYVRFEPRSSKKAGDVGARRGVDGPSTARRRSVFRLVRNGAIAAAILVGIGVGTFYFLTKPVATVSNLVDVQWANAQAPLAIGDSLPQSKVAIAGGFLRVTFTSGASVVVQGPAELQVDSASKMQLLSGKLTTAVPHDAVGFTVETPAAYVVDLGTEVGIKVADGTQTHVEVFKGRAQVDMPDAAGTTTVASQVLEPAMAVNVAARGTSIEKAVAQPLAFVRQEELLERAKEPANPLAALQSSRSSILQDPSLIAYYSFDNQDESPAKLLNCAPITSRKLDGTIENAAWEQGRAAGKSGLHFDRKDSQVLVNIPGTFNQLTIATWVNFDQLGTQFSTIFSADHRSTGAFDWKFAIVDGAPSVNIGIGNDAGSLQHFIGGAFDASHLSIGQWHFCVLNYDVDAKVLRCGIDGHWLKALKNKRFEVPHEPAKIDAARIGNQKRSLDERPFIGRMDELVIWERTLSDDEIKSIYDAGKIR